MVVPERDLHSEAVEVKVSLGKAHVMADMLYMATDLMVVAREYIPWCQDFGGGKCRSIWIYNG